MVRRISDKKREWRAERLNVDAEIEAKKDDSSYVSRKAVMENLNMVKKELKKMKEDQQSLVVSL